MLKALSLSRSALLLKKQPVFSILGDPVIDFNFLLNPQYEENMKRRKSVEAELTKLKELYEISSKDNDESSKASLYQLAMKLPNTSHEKTPIGDESQATIISVHGEKPVFNGFAPLSADKVLVKLKVLRLKHFAYGIGDRAYVTLGRLAKLERALIRYTTDQLLKSGFQLVSVPDTFNSEIIEACGFPTEGERHQIYKIDSLYSKDLSFQHCLSGTSEIALGGLCAYRTLPTHHLPLKLCAVSRCYRREVPHHEPELYRVNQFSKVEMFCLTSGSRKFSDTMFDEIVNIQRSMFTDLGLHIRIMEMPTEELGLPAHRKVDIEAWMPGENKFGEISSASNCTDFQSRRLHIKEKTESQDEEQFVHTLNGTGCAIPRIIKAIVETHQTEKGTVSIPSVLKPYMDDHELALTQQYPPVKMIYIHKLYASIHDSLYL